ncbi:hypothetical protein MIND_00585700 [Mycena indigotica]|uniref:poly(ADP-ribose) glycohydrolase n=1 Tax=Mycena indigotica TaxID=2126181 RepID=A0A8H6W8X0_9AGAR|nr:uncharacterized protein MIND_00585700 [Mycena indigotica]KAF7303564.1 hypothetical protein MIND_00585700 [Mycena indigotica]
MPGGVVLPHSALCVVNDRLSLVDQACSGSCPFSSSLQQDPPHDGDDPIFFLHVLRHTPGIAPPAANATDLFDALDTIAVTLRGETDDLGFLREFFGPESVFWDAKEHLFGVTSTRRERFFDCVWPRIVDIALNLPNLFPSGHAPTLVSVEKIHLTRQQTACLVAHQFLCTLPRAGGKAYEELDSMDLHIWFSRDQPHPYAVQAYLTALIVFLERTVMEEDVDRDTTFTLTGPFAPSDSTRNRSFCPVELDVRGHDAIVISPQSVGLQYSADVGASNACVISANKHPGFGRTASQEEMHVGCSPASWVLKLVMPTSGLPDDQALVVEGCELIVEMTGFSRSARLSGISLSENKWSSRTMLFMDALPFDAYDTTTSTAIIPDLLPGNVEREFKKACAAFNSAPYDQIITGHWGCGSFAGNKPVKAIIQWCAASMSGIGRLKFICWPGEDESFPDEFSGFIELVANGGYTVANLLDVLLKLRTDDEPARHKSHFVTQFDFLF